MSRMYRGKLSRSLEQTGSKILSQTSQRRRMSGRDAVQGGGGASERWMGKAHWGSSMGVRSEEWGAAGVRGGQGGGGGTCMKSAPDKGSKQKGWRKGRAHSIWKTRPAHWPRLQAAFHFLISCVCQCVSMSAEGGQRSALAVYSQASFTPWTPFLDTGLLIDLECTEEARLAGHSAARITCLNLSGPGIRSTPPWVLDINSCPSLCSRYLSKWAIFQILPLTFKLMKYFLKNLQFYSLISHITGAWAPPACNAKALSHSHEVVVLYCHTVTTE